MSAIKPHSTIARSKELVSSEMDGEVVMMSIQTGTYYGLNDVGTHIWNQLAAPRSFQDICQSLQGEFDVDAQTCEQEVRTFVAQMMEEKLVVIEE